jgi:nucleoside-diphosphate-sugar epimerase
MFAPYPIWKDRGMRILVIGGTGFIGKATAAALAERGDEVTLFNRGKSDPDNSLPSIQGDVDNLRDFTAEIHALRPEAIVHCIAYTRKAAEDLVAVSEGLDAHLVVLSSEDCYDAFHRIVTDRDPGDLPIDETFPLAPPLYWKGTGHPRADEYDKNQMTEVVLAAHGDRPVTVLRLPMVWGPGDPQFQHRHGAIIWNLLDRRERMVLGANEQARIWSHGYIDDVAGAIVRSIGEPAVYGLALNLAEHKVRSWRRWAELYCEAADRHPEIAIVPDYMIEDGSHPNSPCPHVFSDAALFRSLTGWRDRVAIEDAVARTWAWAQQHPDGIGPQPDYDRLDRAAEAMGSFQGAQS